MVPAVSERTVSPAGDHLPVLRLLWDEPIRPAELHQSVQRARLRFETDQQTLSRQEHGCSGWPYRVRVPCWVCVNKHITAVCLKSTVPQGSQTALNIFHRFHRSFCYCGNVSVACRYLSSLILVEGMDIDSLHKCALEDCTEQHQFASAPDVIKVWPESLNSASMNIMSCNCKKNSH